ncbi:MAG: MarR family transcriptional regulator [Ruminococcaceae bacterium]|nr:MarR family transcriptional regulator [Oscillospiraceae bacterium]
MNAELLQKHLVKWAKAFRITSQNTIMPACREFGLTYQQFTILAELSRSDGLSAGELSDRVCILRSNFAAVARKLEDGNLICQEKNPQDRRYSILRLTEEGEDLVQRMIHWMEERYADAFRDLPEDLFDALIRGTDAVEEISQRIETINQLGQNEAEEACLL